MRYAKERNIAKRRGTDAPEKRESKKMQHRLLFEDLVNLCRARLCFAAFYGNLIPFQSKMERDLQQIRENYVI